MNYIVRVDKKGRIVIPSSIREALGIGRVVRLYVEGRKIIIEPIEDPIERLSKLVIKSYIEASTEPEKVSRIASEQLVKECEK
ncbi:MAG: MraZ N-terminal domain containing protein [Desulfurococcales archaeon]|nr:MraZ N-terminal domain containing protein [Desulfurococcales archaeon]